MERKQSKDSSEMEKGTQSRADGLQVDNGLLQNHNGPIMNEKDPNEVAVDAFVVDENDSEYKEKIRRKTQILRLLADCKISTPDRKTVLRRNQNQLQEHGLGQGRSLDIR